MQSKAPTLSPEAVPDDLYSLIREHIANPARAQLDAGTNLELIGLDSLEAVSLALDIEEAFGIMIDDLYLVRETFLTPQAIWRAVCLSGGAGTSGQGRTADD